MLVFLIFFIFLGISEQACKTPFFAVNGFDGCLYYGTSGSTYSQAQTSCRSSNGRLVAIHNAFVNNLLLQYVIEKADLVRSFWIGLRRNDPRTRDWIWDDESTVDYANLGYVDAINDNVIMLPNGTWTTEDANVAHPYLCQQTACPFGWKLNTQNNYCYGMAYNMSFYNAETYCRGYGGHLASVHSKDEENFIYQVAYAPCPGGGGSPHEVVLGGYWNGSQLTGWTDGTPADYMGTECILRSGNVVRFASDDQGCGGCDPHTWLNGYGEAKDTFARLVCKLESPLPPSA